MHIKRNRILAEIIYTTTNRFETPIVKHVLTDGNGGGGRCWDGSDNESHS